MSGLRIKQGESFSLEGQYLEDDGVTAKSLIDVDIASQVRTKRGELIAHLLVTVLDEPAGLYRLSAPLGTADWPVTELYWDIRTTQGSLIKYSETNKIRVERGITKL